MNSRHADSDQTLPVALAADLMFASRIRGAAQAAGRDVKLATGEAALEDAVRAGAPLVLLDLGRRGDMPALIRRLKADPATASVTVVAFGSHVDAVALTAARAAGADRVMARSAFVKALPGLLAGGSA